MQNLKNNYVTFVNSLSDSEIKSINSSQKSIYAHKKGVGAAAFYAAATGHNDQSDVMIFDSEGAADHILPTSQFRQQLIDDAENHLQEFAHG